MLVLLVSGQENCVLTVRVWTFLSFECGVRSAQCACGPHSRTVYVRLIASFTLIGVRHAGVSTNIHGFGLCGFLTISLMCLGSFLVSSYI